MVQSSVLEFLNTRTDLVRHMFKDDTHYTIIEGKNKSGKSTLSLLFAEDIYRLNKELRFKGFGSNIKGVKDCPFEMDFVTDLETLEEILIDTRGKYLFIFDEMGKSLGKRKHMARLNIEFLEKLQVIRKYRLSLIGCAIGDSIDRELKKPYYLNSYIDKGSRYTKNQFTYFDIDLEGYRQFENVPKCVTSFKQYSVATFYLKKQFSYRNLKDEEHQILLRWARGDTIRDLGLHTVEFHRILKRFIEQELKGKASITV